MTVKRSWAVIPDTKGIGISDSYDLQFLNLQLKIHWTNFASV